ncbi:RND family efflux transporter, MFP subunit [Synechococcus sp. PCC 7502]|uniref:efflux RND transporter periplasmic adaptor subunit n=1 Tax=Synechococcus sp. PCC 7502 TaxID=1173263 RepID=UPI00029FE3DD|nr:efflux RND transporter periplasmic adaptor subunit [Synechococcus sp. PCC 7502]AFY72824.1 RND family efflux transporter, MFP subunit [Synechococcus sp. PCC 7502]
MSYSHLSLFVSGVVVLSLPWVISACGTSNSQTEARPPVPVEIAMAMTKTIPVEIRSNGVVEAYSTVAVKSQVGGQLIAVNFKEGQAVKKGDLLFKIDPLPLEASLQQAIANQAKNRAQLNQALANQVKAIALIDQARATKAKDLALAKNADVQTQRYTSLLEQGVTSKQQLEEFQTNSAVFKATLNADQNAIENAIAAAEGTKADIEAAKAEIAAGEAAIESAKVQLSYTTIFSPVDGKTSSLNVDQGNLVKADDTSPLVVISQVKPIYVRFTIPERSLFDVRKYSAQHKLTVIANIGGNTGTKKSAEKLNQNPKGELTFIDSIVDTTTGTVLLKATFPNTKAQLSPGQRLDVRLLLTQAQNAIVVPSTAIQTGQKGQFVYVVKPDNSVDMRSVKVGTTVGNESVIIEGLKAKEAVVIDGQFNLTPKSIVTVKIAEKNQSPDQSKDIPKQTSQN